MKFSRASVFAACLGLFGLGAWVMLARDDAEAEFAAALKALPSCRVDADCTLIQTTCPLGCAHSVNVSEHARIKKLAARLSERHAKAHGACAYDCLTSGPVICDAGRCKIEGKN